MMKAKLFAAAAPAAVLISALLVPAVPAAAQAPGDDSALLGQNCDRACLLDALKQYMDAMRADSPSSAPLAHNVVFSENNVILPVGKGVWGRIDKVDAVGMEAADPHTRNAAWFGSIFENGEPAIFAVRIHVTDGKIDEVESVVHRKIPLPAPFGDVTNMVHSDEFNQVLPKEQRKSRARLIDMADAYFDTVQINDGHVFASFAPDCGRLENGISTTARTARSSANFVEGCEAQFKLGMYRINKRIRDRRYPIVDEERGVVVSTGFFDHDNELNRYTIKNGREIKTALNWPNSISLLEAFRIKEGAISQIEAVFTYVPYFMHNPWAGIGSKPPQHLADPKACDTRCLTDMTSKTVQAYATRGWNALPWADHVAYNENSSGMPVGEGSWLTINAVDKNPLIVSDASLGTSVWIGRVDNHDQPSWGAITVKAGGDKIGGVSALFHHKEYGQPYAEPGAAPSFSALSASQRTTRATMLREVDAFYRALNAKDGKAPGNLAADCQWGLNGLNVGACEPPFTQRLIAGLEQVRDIELLAVDEARGLVVMSTFEDFPATEPAAAGQPHWPRTLQVTELFRFEKGKIARIEAYTAELPYGMKPHGEAIVVDPSKAKYSATLMKPTP